MSEGAASRRRFRLPELGDPSKVIAWATVVNALVAALLFIATCRTAQIAQQAFEHGYRPAIGIASMDAVPDSARHSLHFITVMKNFGPGIASEVDISLRPYLNGVIQETRGVPDKPREMFPGEMTRLESRIGEPTYSQVLAGTTTVEMIVCVSYRGPANVPYSYASRPRYNPAVGAFMNLGPPQDNQCDA